MAFKPGFITILMCGACATPPPTEGVSLVEHSSWSAVTPEADPFDDRPATVDCPSVAWGVEVDGEQTAVEIDTELCDYACLVQPSQVDVFSGDAVGLTWGHSALEADVPASAHVSVRLGDLVLWDSDEPIPSDADERNVDLVVDTDYPAGTPIYVHVHNHGDNQWNFSRISVEAGP